MVITGSDDCDAILDENTGHGRLTFNSLFCLDFVSGGGAGVSLDQRN